MRWFVEISALGKKPLNATTLCVEATQWQPALQRARAMRGDDGPLSNFSIELLDDGYRAIDPSARLKYVVKRAPDDAALTNGEHAKALKSEPPPASEKPAPKAQSERPLAPSKPPEKAPEPVKVAKSEPPPPLKVASAPAPAPAPAKVAAPPRPESVKPAPVEAVEAKPLIAIPLDQPPPPPARPGLPKHTIQSKREEPPTAKSPLHYREYVIVVAEGTSEDDAERLARDKFAEVKKALAPAKAGKLANIAVFDHAFSTKPKRPPLVTLTWKDWRGDAPEVRIPSREPGETPTPLALAPVVAPAPPKAAARAPEPEPEPEPAPPPAVEAAPAEVEVDVETAAAATAPSEDAETVSGVDSEPPLAGPKTIIETPRIEMMPDAPASFPTQSIVPPTPSQVPPPPKQPSGAQPVPPAVPSLSKRKKRLAGDDLLSELFEALSELGFMHDSLAGAEYVLAVALDKIPSEVGIVSFFDINKREFVVVKQMGGETGVLGFRQPEKASLAIQAMRTKHAVVVTDTDEVALANDDRWRGVGVELRCLVCAPIALGGRYLGLIEIANPTDDSIYREGDGNALTYVGQQFGEFLAERGVVIDSEHILESAKASAALHAAKRPSAR